MIRKVKGGYRVVAKSGRNMGTYKTEEEAKKRLRQIELFKHQKPQAQLCSNWRMKRVISVHGWGGYPDEGWRPWLKKELEQKGFDVINPSMPDTETPTIQKWLPYITEAIVKPDKNTYLIGHSLGCITILRYLEKLEENQAIGGAVLVAGFGHDLEYGGYKGELSSFFKDPIDWEKIKKRSGKFFVLYSNNDPFVPKKYAVELGEKLEVEPIVQHNMKHFSGGDGITELPIARDLILDISA